MATMQGKICLITGGTNGIGKIAALELARMGATVVIIGRNPTKTAQVVAEIKAATGSTTVDSIIADLSSQADIRHAASTFLERYQHLHVLLNNAGVLNAKRELSVDGIEMTFAVNHLAYFLLTTLLLDTIRASAPARIINVASGAHTLGKVDFSNLQGERSYRGMTAYSNSKLENVLFTIELAHRLQGTGVTVNAIHPGFVNTGWGKTGSSMTARLLSLFGPVMGRTPEKGAATSIYLATSPEVASVTGKYFFDSKEKQTAKQATDLEAAGKLWEVSAMLVNRSDTAPASV